MRVDDRVHAIYTVVLWYEDMDEGIFRGEPLLSCMYVCMYTEHKEKHKREGGREKLMRFCF
jgi:hypothetical protein